MKRKSTCFRRLSDSGESKRFPKSENTTNRTNRATITTQIAIVTRVSCALASTFSFGNGFVTVCKTPFCSEASIGTGLPSRHSFPDGHDEQLDAAT